MPARLGGARRLLSATYLDTTTTCAWYCKDSDTCTYYFTNDYRLANMDYIKATFQAGAGIAIVQKTIDYHVDGLISFLMDVTSKAPKTTRYISFQGVDKDDNGYYFMAYGCKEIPEPLIPPPPPPLSPPPPSPPPSPPPASLWGFYYITGIKNSNTPNSSWFGPIVLRFNTGGRPTRKVNVRFTDNEGNIFFTADVVAGSDMSKFRVTYPENKEFAIKLIDGGWAEVRAYFGGSGEPPSTWSVLPNIMDPT